MGLIANLRKVLRETSAQAGITAHIVPHQLRHTYATSLLRAGVSLPALMKLLGHRCANMTLRYVEITQKDLQREFHLARLNPRHLIPLPTQLSTPLQISDAATPADIFPLLTASIRILEVLPPNPEPSVAKLFLLLRRRLVRILSRLQKLIPIRDGEK